MKTRAKIFTLIATLMTFTSTGQSVIFADTNSENYTVVQKPLTLVMGIECRTSNDLDAGPHDIPKHWERFFSEKIYDQIPNKDSCEIVALYCDYQTDHTQAYSLLIGCPVNSLDVIPEGMTTKIIPAGSYAMFQAIGEHPQSLIETWGRIWQTNLKRIYTGDYEVYGDKFFGTPKEVEVFIAIDEVK